MAFDWMRFLESNSVHHQTTGPNVSRGFVVVRCPMCGSEDHGEHMSINLKSGGWRCFRRPDSHRGGNPAGLVAALLGINAESARAIVGTNVHIPDDVLGTVRGLLGPTVHKDPARIAMPAEFKPIRYQRSAKRFRDYLKGPSRNFTDKEIDRLTDEYGLRYCTQGKFRGRIIFPVWDHGKLVSYTGRTIYPDQELRYLTLSTDAEKDDPPAWGPINDYLLFYDQLVENADDCDTLILCEGPFDALKVSVLGRPYGIEATCFFTATPSQAQIYKLHDLVPVYRNRYLMLDAGTLAAALRTQFDMEALQCTVLTLPKNTKDPGLLTRDQLLKIVP
jgi:hypothetical protein